MIYLLCYDLAKPAHGKKAKKKVDSSTRTVLNDLANIIKKEVYNLDSCLDTWKVPEVCDLSDRLALLNLSADGQNSVFDDIKNSHIIAVKELRTLLKSKVKLLSGVNG